MRKLILAASLSMSLMVACSSKPRAEAGAGAPARDPRNPVIVHIVSQHQTITVSSSPTGLLYSLKDADGRVRIADATSEEFAELRPELYRNIKRYIAVHADDAPLPADAGMAPVPAQVLDASRLQQ